MIIWIIRIELSHKCNGEPRYECPGSAYRRARGLGTLYIPINSLNYLSIKLFFHFKIQTAIKFLQNPNVIKTGLAQKQNFLKRKGLTDREIQVACERSGAYQHHEEQQQTRTAPQLPPPVTYGPLQVSLFDRVREVVHNIAIFSIVAYFIHKIYKVRYRPLIRWTLK